MAKKPQSEKPEEIETEPDAWPRFERFISDVAKAGPQHRKPKGTDKPPKSKPKPKPTK